MPAPTPAGSGLAAIRWKSAKPPAPTIAMPLPSNCPAIFQRLGCKLAAPELKRTHGLILNLIDIHALRPLRHHTVYSVAKAGLATLTRSLARELAPDVRVNGIAPGPVLWPEGDIDPDVKQEIMERTALKRMGTPDLCRADRAKPSNATSNTRP